MGDIGECSLRCHVGWYFRIEPAGVFQALHVSPIVDKHRHTMLGGTLSLFWVNLNRDGYHFS